MEIETCQLTFNHKSVKNLKDHPRFSMKHSHSGYEIIFFEEGDADYVVEGRVYHLKKNDLIFTRPYSYHYIKINSNSAYTRYDILFTNQVIENKYTEKVQEDLEVINCNDFEIIKQIFNKLGYYSTRFNEQDFIDVLLMQIKEILLNLSNVTLGAIPIPAELSPALTRALQYIGQNLLTIKDVKEVSDALSLSQSYFFKQFKSQLKISPKNYINLKRLQYAQNLIRQGKKPTEVYFDCGFESYVGFYKQYIKQFGYSPSQEK